MLAAAQWCPVIVYNVLHFHVHVMMGFVYIYILWTLLFFHVVDHKITIDLLLRYKLTKKVNKIINLSIEPFNYFFLRKGMCQKYDLLYYLKQVYVGAFFHWSEQKLQTGLLKMYSFSASRRCFWNVRNIAFPR